MCELLIQGYPNVKIAGMFGVSENAIKHCFGRMYRKFGINYRGCLPHICLAVMLTYDRHPELIPRPGVGATISYRHEPGWIYRDHPGECSISYTQPKADVLYHPTRQDKPPSASPDYDSTALGRISTANSYIH
jgi:hypothetical protein